MGKDFKLPDLGEGIHEAQIVNVMIKQGDTVQPDQMVMEVETDKASVELPVPFGGVIQKLNVKQGDTVKVGTVLLSVGEGGEGGDEGKEEAPPGKPAGKKKPQPADKEKPPAKAQAAAQSPPA